MCINELILRLVRACRQAKQIPEDLKWFWHFSPHKDLPSMPCSSLSPFPHPSWGRGFTNGVFPALQNPMRSVTRKALPLWFGKRRPRGTLRLSGVLAMPPVRMSACLGWGNGPPSFILHPSFFASKMRTMWMREESMINGLSALCSRLSEFSLDFCSS